MGSRRLTTVLLSIAILSVFFQNCSRVGFTDNGKASVSGAPVSPGLPSAVNISQALVTCASAASQGRLQEQEFPVLFDDPINEVGSAPVCSWNQAGNVAPQNGYMTARYTQDRDISLPPGAILCGVDFLFGTQAMEYDDTFFFTVNGYVLATNDDYWMTSYFAKQNLNIGGNQNIALSTYDWSRLVGQPNNLRAMKPPGTDYCLGAQEGLSQCSWPRTETAGSIAMNVSSNVMTALGLTTQNGNIHLGFVTTGDDNPATDCQHEPLSMRLKVRYVIP